MKTLVISPETLRLGAALFTQLLADNAGSDAVTVTIDAPTPPPAPPAAPPAPPAPAPAAEPEPAAPQPETTDRYWYHPESDAYMETKAGEVLPTDPDFGLCYEISRANYDAGVAIQNAPPEYVESDACRATGYTIDQYRASNWTDEALIKAGYLVEAPKLAHTTMPEPLVSSAPTASDVAPSAPAAPAPPAPPTSPAVELDKDGVPWDARIHSDTKDPAERMAKTGYWKRKRNVSEEEHARVTAELQALAGGAPAAPKPDAPAPAAPPAPAAAPSPSAPAPVTSPSANPATEPATFNELTNWLTGHIQAGRLAIGDSEAEVKAVGLEKLPQLIQFPQHIPAVYAGLVKRLRAEG